MRSPRGPSYPGARLGEAALAKHFSVSTTPIREALRRLDRQGLVRLAPNRGALVTEFNLQEILDLFEIRELLECGAARRAANQSSRDERHAQSIIAVDPLYGPETLLLMQSHHQGILEAVQDGSARQAEARVRAHIRYIRDSVADVLGSAEQLENASAHNQE